MTFTIPRRSETRSGAAYVAVGTGEPLVLIHGVGLRLDAWAAQIDGLSATHRVIALDMPGHGGSAPLAHDARLPDFVAWLAQAFDDLGLERANLAGHSMGALITGGMVAEHPDRLDRVALLCGVHRRTPEAAAAVRARAEALRNGERDSTGPLARWFGEDRSSHAYALVREWLDTVDGEHRGAQAEHHHHDLHAPLRVDGLREQHERHDHGAELLQLQQYAAPPAVRGLGEHHRQQQRGDERVLRRVERPAAAAEPHRERKRQRDLQHGHAGVDELRVVLRAHDDQHHVHQHHEEHARTPGVRPRARARDSGTLRAARPSRRRMRRP